MKSDVAFLFAELAPHFPPQDLCCFVCMYAFICICVCVHVYVKVPVSPFLCSHLSFSSCVLLMVLVLP